MIGFARSYPRLILTIAALLPLVVGYHIFSFDLNPPSVLSPQESIPTVRAGEELHLSMANKRDLTRNCSMEISRDLVDSTKQRRTLFGSQKVSAQGFKDREKYSPGRLALTIPIPQNVPSGEAHILTNATYNCPMNVASWFFPIQESYDWKFVVLPPEPKTIVVIPARP